MLRLLILCAALAGTAAAYLGLMAPSRAPRPEGIVNAKVGEVSLRFDSAYLPRAGGRSAAGLDLVALFPDFRPLPSQEPESAPAQPENIVVLRLEPEDATVDPADRTAKLYAGFLVDESWSHPGGLVMRRFEKGTPYENEDLYLAPPEGHRFAARCQAPSRKLDDLPSTCLWAFRMNGLDVQMRFSPDLLSSWEVLVERGRGLVASVLR